MPHPSTPRAASDAVKSAFRDLLPLSERWWREIRGHQKTLQLLLAAVPDIAEKRLLDVGSGIGILVHTLNRARARAEGVDKHVLVEWGMEPERVRSLWQEKGMRIHVADFFTAELPASTYRAITAENIIEHLPYTQKEFLEKIHALLQPGGTLVLSTPNAAAFLKRVRASFGRSNGWDLADFFHNKMPFGHVREFTGHELGQMCTWSGFTVSRLAYHNIYLRKGWLRMPKKWPWVLIFFLTAVLPSMRDTVFVVAQKKETATPAAA